VHGVTGARAALGNPSSVVGVVGVLALRDADGDDAQDMVRLGRAYRSSGFSNAGIKGSCVDAGEVAGRESNGEKGEP
jgi:hypothetical protein